MQVHILVQEYLSYWDNDFTTNVYAFKDRQSAINYLKELKESTLEEIMAEYNYKSIDDLNADCDYFEMEDEDWFCIRLDEYGTECLYISKQDVMEMN